MTATAQPVPHQPRSTWRRRFLSEEAVTAYFFILPSLIGFIAFYAVPAVRGLNISFTNWDLLRDPKYIGFTNYTNMMKDAEFLNALKVTVYYVLLNIPLQTMLALVIAVMMHRLTQSMLIRSIIILPWLMPPVVVGLLWLWLLDPALGIINAWITGLGLPMVPFLNLPKFAMPSIAMINIWQYVGYTALLIFAGLQSIPGSVYEAASIDGASETTTFWRITVPLLRPVLVFVVVTSVIGSFQIFDTIAITTKGGPVNATKVINYLIYGTAFERFKMGYATAISVVLFLILVVVSIIQMRLSRASESDM